MRNVARAFNVNHATISRLRDQFQATGNINDPLRSGRPRSFLNVDGPYIRLSAPQNSIMGIIGSMRSCTHTCEPTEVTQKSNLIEHCDIGN